MLLRVLTVLIPLIVLGVCAAVLYAVTRPPAEAEGDASPDQPLPPSDLPAPGADLGVPPTAPTPTLDQLVAGMRTRYRPGPFVQVVGMLPSGQAQGSAMSWLNRSGRSLDNPWLVRHGKLLPNRAPSASPGGDRPTLSNGPGEQPNQPLSVVAGVPNWIKVRVAHPAADRQIKGFHVAFGSYLGHFFLPASGEGQDGEVGAVFVGTADMSTIEFGIDAAVLPGGSPISGQPYAVTMYIGAEDDQGLISDYVTRQIQVVPVGTGDVEVTLTMDQATDLDLYVVEPTGVAIYYRNTTSFTGGRLDLDANAACSSNVGINNEHVFWPRGMSPAGVYTVRVANYTSCIGGGAVGYQITVRNCGETAILSGSFTGTGNRSACTQSPGMDPSWCHEVVTFQVTPCETNTAAP